MRRIQIIAGLTIMVALLSSGASFAQIAEKKAPVRTKRPNIVSVEIGGRAFIYSANYERYITDKFGIGVGAMGFGNNEGGFGLIPVYVSFNPIGDEHSLYLSAGATIAVGGLAGVPGGVESAVLGTAQIGYQLQQESGFFFRPTMSVLFNKHGFLAWPGISVGGSF